MTNGEFEKVYKDKKLNEYICAQARRHFKYEDDIEDAKQEAWIRICMMDYELPIEEYKHWALQAIDNIHHRVKLRSMKEVPLSWVYENDKSKMD